MITETIPELTLPTLEELTGDEDTVIFPESHVAAKVTDMAVITGADISDDAYGFYFTCTPNSTKDGAVEVSDGGKIVDLTTTDQRSDAIRPIIKSKELYDKLSSKMYKNEDGEYVVEYGYYPQDIVPSYMQKILTGELDNLFNGRNTELVRKDFSFTFNNVDSTDKFQGDSHTVFEYCGKYFVLKQVTLYNNLLNESKFHPASFDGNEHIHNGDEVWVEISPAEWLVDTNKKVLFAKKGLISGIPFDTKSTYDGDFENTVTKEYLNKHLAPELYKSAEFFKGLKKSSYKTKGDKINPYGFNFDEVSEEDIIRGAVESDIPVFLHAKSGDGKSARTKELDPDYVRIWMINATPESLIGKSVFNSQTAEMIDVKPSWLKKLEEKCEKEPNKLHVLFFDELTNALPSMQALAFNIVLDKEVNGVWKLPENVRIVAAGNEMEDSLAANPLADPLYNRFAHVFLETTPEGWLEWAATPEEEYERLDYNKPPKRAKIHPAIYAFIAANTYTGNGLGVLRTKPKENVQEPHADPRRWEMASKVLYATNNPEMLRGLIGEELTREFVKFTQVKTITVEDVINGNYTESDLQMNTAEKFATAVGLSSVDEEHFLVVREFLQKLGAEVCAAFESMWHHGEEKRLMIIAEAQVSQGGKRL